MELESGHRIISLPYKTGIRIKPQILNLTENNEMATLDIIQMSPVFGNLTLQLSSQNSDISDISDDDIIFDPGCTIRIPKTPPDIICNSETGCRSHSIRIKALQRYHGQTRRRRRQGIVIIQSMDETNKYWEEEKLENVGYVIQNLPTSQCHAFTYSHFVTFDQRRFDGFLSGGTFILQRNADYEVQISVDENSIICQLMAMEDESLIIFDYCGNKSEIYSNNPDLISAIKKNVYLIRWPKSRRFIRVNVDDRISGLSLTLQAIGADFQTSVGLCGLFDNKSGNDFHSKDKEILKDSRNFMKVWRYKVLFLFKCWILYAEMLDLVIFIINKKKFLLYIQYQKLLILYKLIIFLLLLIFF